MNNKAIRLAAAGALTALLAGLAVPAQAATDPCSPLVDSVKICLAPDGRHYPVLVNSAVTVPGPTIGGALLVGNTLTAIDGPVDPWGAMLTHQWLRNDVPILGATGTTYTLTRSDLGKGIRVETTATAPDYAKTTVQSAKSAPVTAAAGAVPTIQILQVKVTTKSTTNFVIAEPLSLGPKGRLYLYQWLRDREPIPGATGKTFDTTGWAPPAALSVRVTAYAPGYDPATSTSTPVAVYPENATPGAIVAGGTGVGDVLTGTDTAPWQVYIPRGETAYAHHYKWLRDGAEIDGATGLTYTITAEDQGHTLVLMTDTSRYDAYSRPIAVPAAVPVPADVELKQLTNVARPVLTGNSVTGSLMTVTAGTWSEPAENLTITYDWLSPDGKVSSGGDSFVPNNTHVGSTITVLVTVSAPGYATSRVKVTAQKPVTAADPYQTKSPSINGVLRMGLIVEVSGGEWSDYPAGLSGTWQWLRDDVPVKGATGGSYHLRAEDVGKRISVSHTVTLNGRVLKTETVGAGSVAPAFLKAAKPTISGTVKVGKVLTARPGAWTQGTSFKYRWLRNGVPISGATSSTYKVRTADRDKRITVEVTGSRLGYTTVTQTSGAYFAR